MSVDALSICTSIWPSHRRESGFSDLEQLAAGSKSFRVSDAVRRRKVVGARTCLPHLLSYGFLDFGPIWMSEIGAEMQTVGERTVCILVGRRGRCDADGPL